MTFKKLLKEAAKVDPSTFKVGPKVKVQPRLPEKGKLVEKPKTPTLSSTSIPASMAKSHLPAKSSTTKPMSPIITGMKPQKSAIERALSSSSRSVSPHAPLKPSSSTKKPATSVPPKSGMPNAKPSSSSSSKDAKSRLRESFVPNELIPLAQGPRRDLRTIEEIQNDLWRKKGKNYPSVATQKLASPQIRSSVLSVQKSPQKQSMKKRRRESDESEDSFIVSEEAEKPEMDYRAEIRAMFKRKGPSRMEHSDEDSDMEATGFEMEREERRAALLAKKEDEEEERREEQRAQEKKRRKMELERKKMKSGK
jgi:protein SPT2